MERQGRAYAVWHSGVGTRCRPSQQLPVAVATDALVVSSPDHKAHRTDGVMPKRGSQPVARAPKQDRLAEQQRTDEQQPLAATPALHPSAKFVEDAILGPLKAELEASSALDPLVFCGHSGVGCRNLQGKFGEAPGSRVLRSRDGPVLGHIRAQCRGTADSDAPQVP